MACLEIIDRRREKRSLPAGKDDERAAGLAAEAIRRGAGEAFSGQMA